MNYLVLDTDSITGVWAETFLEWENANRIPFSEAYLSGKSSIINERFREMLQSLSPGVKVYVFSASSLKHHADILCGYSIGRIVERTKHFPDAEIAKVFILSKDHLVTSLAREALSEGLSVVVLNDSIAKLDGLERVEFLTTQTERTKKPTFKPGKKLPQWYNRNLTTSESAIGLRCEKVPSEEFLPKPSFVPFPLDTPVFTIGGRSSDIDLSVWDVAQGLYPNNVEIGYRAFPDSVWTIRSRKGTRRGKRQIAVDGTPIIDVTGEVSITENSVIDLGGFRFRFHADKVETWLRFESVNTICDLIETNLQKCVRRIPWDMVNRVGCLVWRKDQVSKQQIQVPLRENLSNADYAAYSVIIHELWNWFPVIARHYGSRASFSTEFSAIKMARNNNAHKSSGGASEREKRALLDFLFLTEKELNTPPSLKKVNTHPVSSGLGDFAAALEKAFGRSV